MNSPEVSTDRWARLCVLAAIFFAGFSACLRFEPSDLDVARGGRLGLPGVLSSGSTTAAGSGVVRFVAALSTGTSVTGDMLSVNISGNRVVWVGAQTMSGCAGIDWTDAVHDAATGKFFALGQKGVETRIWSAIDEASWIPVAQLTGSGLGRTIASRPPSPCGTGLEVRF